MFEKESLYLVVVTCCLILSSLPTIIVADAAKKNRCDQLDGVRNDRINCTSSGEVSCYEGWSGELCNNAICREGCHTIHGYCTQPGECKCALGWRGKNCDECVPLPGCKHGFCSTTSYECICEPGWEGNYCSIPVCRKGCHSSRGSCKFPHECRCRIGWGGDTCEECKPLPRCMNGYCTKPLECRCREGWTGLLCDSPICRKNCSLDHGFCTKPGECRCEVGWWGENCETCFPYPGCKHGTCDSPWECICDEGWKGIFCDQKNETGESFCDKNPGVCLNGGTCINVPDERNYTCSCPSLFTGKHCDYLAYSRASIFPIFSRGSSGSRSTLSTTSFPTLSTTTSTSSTSTANETTTITTSTLNSTDNTPRESNVSPVSSITMSVSVSPLFSAESSIEKKENINSEQETLSSEEINQTLNTDEILIGEDLDGIQRLSVLRSTEPSSGFDSDVLTLGNKRRKYIERKSQSKTTSKQSNNPEKENVFPSRTLDSRGSEYFSERRVIGARRSNKPGLIKPPTPILVLELSEPTLDFDDNLNEDPITHTDANSPQANQITGKNRFLRHHEAVLSLSSSERTGQQSSFFPLRKVRLVPQEKSPRPSRLRGSPFILTEGLDSLPQESSHGEGPFHSFSRDFSFLPPQTRINRKTGIPPSLPINVLPTTSSLGRFSPHEDHELAEASDAKEHKDKVEDEEIPKTYYEEHYDGRVHIGDVTEVDEHAPLEEIVDAFIELKKLTS